MALENPYCTLADVQSETGNSESTLTARYEDIINLASRYIDTITQKDFLPHDFTSEPFIPKERNIAIRTLTIPWQIRTIESLVVQGKEFDELLYEWEGRTIILKTPEQLKSEQVRNYTTMIVRGNAVWPKLKGAIEVYGEFGCTPPTNWNGTSALIAPCADIPAPVRRACAKIAAAWSNEKRRERGTPDGERISILDDRIPDEAMALLRRYLPIHV